MVKRNSSKKTGHILFKELLRSLRMNWKQFLSIIAISFLAICLFSGLSSNASNLSNRTNKLYKDSHFAEIYVTTISYDQDDLSALKSLPNVKKIEQRKYLPITAGGRNLNLIVAEGDLSIPIIDEGGPGFLLMKSFLNPPHNNDLYNDLYDIGDIFEFEVLNPFKSLSPQLATGLANFLIPGKANVFNDDRVKLKAKITGSMYHPEGVKKVDSSSSSLAYAAPSLLYKEALRLFSENYDLEMLDNAIKLLHTDGILKHDNLEDVVADFYKMSDNQILLEVDGDKKTAIENIKRYYEAKKVNNLFFVTNRESLPSYQALNQDVVQALQLTFVFPVIFFFVSALVITTTLSQMIIKQRSQIGAMKAIGVKSKDIYVHYMGYGILLTFVGAILGLFLGPFIIPPVLDIKYSILFEIIKGGVVLLTPLTVISVLILILLAAFCSFFVSRSVIKEKPVVTLRPKTPRVNDKPSNPDGLFYKMTSLSVKMAVRNAWRNKSKSLMVVIGTMGCTALLVCGWGIMDTLNHSIDVDTKINRTIEVLATPLAPSQLLKEKIKMFEGVDYVEESQTLPITITGKTYISSTITLLEPESKFFTPIYAKDGGVTIDKNSAKQIGVKLGDELKITLLGKTYQKRVTNIFTASMMRGIFDLASDYSISASKPDSYYIGIKDGFSAEKVKDELQKLEELDSVITYKGYRKAADEVLSTIAQMTNVIKIFAVLLSLVVIYNLISLNISERSRDIATMKVLGFSFKEISSTLTIELMIDTFIGSLLGVFLGYPMTVLILSVNKTDMISFLYSVNYLSYIYSFLISTVVALIVSFLLNRKIIRIKMVESLKSVE